MEFLASKDAKLVGKDGAVVPVSALQGKLVSFYFSVRLVFKCLESTS